LAKEGYNWMQRQNPPRLPQGQSVPVYCGAITRGAWIVIASWFRVLLVGAWLLLGPCAFALDARQPLTQLNQKVWTTEHGLPDNFVRALLQTRDGYLWLGTQEGLVRFDGQQLRVFDTRNTPQLASNSIVTLCEDTHGTLWIGTDGGGVTRYQHGGFLPALLSRDGLPNNYIREVYASRDGAVWITGHTGGLLRMYGDQQQRWTTSDGLKDDSLRTVLMDRKGRLWIGYNDVGLSVLENGIARHFGPEHGLEGDQVRALLEDRQGRIWVGTRGEGLLLWEGGRFRALTVNDGLPANAIRSLHEDSDGSLWVGLESGGLARYADGKFQVLDTAGGLPHNFVRALQEDREGNLWVGTRAGLLRLRERTVDTWTTTEGLINDNVKTVYADSRGLVWIGTATGLNLLRNGKVELVRLSSHWSHDFVRALEESADGAMWVGTDAGLYRRSANSHQRELLGDHYGRQHGLSDERVRALMDDRQGRVWIGAARGLTVLSTETGRAMPPPGTCVPEDALVHAIARQPDGVVWVGSSQGLYRFANGGCRRLTPNEGLPHESVTSLHVDGGGALWVGTRGGLALARDSGFVAITRRHGLRSDNIFRVLSDHLGALWLTSNHGVSRVDRTQLEAFFRGEAELVQPTNFDTADGMRSSEFSGEGQPGASRGPDGRLWFPTIHGVVALSPAELPPPVGAPPLMIEEVYAGERAYPGGPEPVRIPPGDGNLELRFTAISFSAPERIRFRYRLEGFDADWQDAGRRRVAYYTNLPPGEYRFRVAANPFMGGWPPDEVSLVVHVLPHFYQEGWFHVLCVVVVALLAALAYRLRMRSVQRRFETILAERTRIARDIHDTLMQGVTGISLQLEASSRQMLSSPEKAKQQLDRALEKLDSTLAEARECVLMLRSPKEARPARAQAFEQALRGIAEEAFAGLPVRLEFSVEGTPRDLPAHAQTEILRIAREAITNSVVHAKPHCLQLSVVFQPDLVRLSLRDDGPGFRPDAIHGDHFGIVGMKERAREIGARFELQSSPGQGTCVLLSVPVAE
jgi:ligand-binding sensor domain-containing protein/signal transduction histidine kinase